MLLNTCAGSQFYLLLLVGILVYAAAWLVARRLVRRTAAGPAVLNSLHLAFLVVAAEAVKVGLPPDSLWRQVVLALQLALLAALSVLVIVKLYLGHYLAARKQIAVNSIIRDLIAIVIIAGFVLLFLRHVLKLNLATILTPSAILTAIVGLAMQDTIANLIAGIIIQIEKPFAVNDWINIDGQKGEVREINWRYTKIETLDQLYIVIPNSKISSDKIINYSKPTPIVKEFIEIGVSYDVPPVKVKRAIFDILKANPNITDKRAIEIRIDAYADSSILYKIIYPIAKVAEQRRVKDEVYSAIWYRFRKDGITIPYPIRTVLMAGPAPEPDVSDIIEALSGLSFFEGVNRDNLAYLARFGLLHAVEPGRVLAHEQDPGDSMFFILEGDCQITRNRKPVADLHRGDFFGEMSLLTNEPRIARVEAVTHGRLLEVDRSTFRVLIENEPIMLRQIEAVFEDRLKKRQASDQLEAPEVLKQTWLARFRKLFGLDEA